MWTATLWLQIVQSRSHFHFSGPKVGAIYVLGALGLRLSKKKLGASELEA